MRRLVPPVNVAAPGLDRASAQEVLAYAVDRFHPQLTMACSFQKEESVLAHMLLAIEPAARVFTIDTGALFPETLSTWRAFEERFGLTVEVMTHAARTRPGPSRAAAARPRSTPSRVGSRASKHGSRASAASRG